MKLSAQEFEKLLVPPGHISQDKFATALEESRNSGTNLWEVLVGNDLIRDGDLARLVAESRGLHWLDLGRETIDPVIFNQVPELVAKKRRVIAVSRSVDGIKAGLVDPTDLATIHLLEKRLRDRVVPYLISRRELESALANYRGGLREEFNATLEHIMKGEFNREERDGAVIKLVDLLLRYGQESKASDVHIEPEPGKVLVRFRIDGVMHDIVEIPKNLHEVILARIKILARMRIDEHRSAQDGKLQFLSNDEAVDVRVSTVPVTNGENAVLRLLSEQSRRFSLSDLGLSEADLEKVKLAIKNPHGIILVTGPTGSGKTTTVYSLVKILNTRDVHVSSIEDPVEYDIEGVSQIQVDPKVNLTFASGLRAIVRQDPDIIVVGEIRDEETAGIAINSAMTGHLVLSTLHANDAATTLPRLLDMGIEPFLVASTVNVIIAQRLVRKICDRCRVSIGPTPEILGLIEREGEIKAAFKRLGITSTKKLTLYHGSGCEVCSHTGYAGRVGIFEVMEMTEALKKLVVERARVQEIVKAACTKSGGKANEGMTLMLEDGIAKVLAGVTTFDEVVRVARA